MKIGSFLHCPLRSQIFCLATILLIMLAWNIPAFCGEIHDAAKAGDLTEVKTLLKKSPIWLTAKTAKAGRLCIGLWRLAKRISWNCYWLRMPRSMSKISMGKRLYRCQWILGVFFSDECCNMAIVEWLLAKGADVNARDDIGHTPLHRAASIGCKTIAELLLSNKADVNAII
jgi:hypothetical protein